MKVVAACLLALLSMMSLALADGAPPPRMPTADGGKTADMPDVPQVTPHGKQEEFVLPSGNIGCIYTPEGGTAVYQPADGGPELSCDRIEPRYVRATLAREGAATLYKDVGDQSCCSAGPVLNYGETWAGGPFSCLSTRTGLSCERDDGHSFFLSRKRLAAN